MEYLAKLLNSTGAQITFFFETRSSTYNSSQINSHFSTMGSFVVPSDGLSGGLWLLWSDKVQVSIKFSNHYPILAVVHISTNNVKFALSCVYGDPPHRLQR
jgi:hypothetical protein